MTRYTPDDIARLGQSARDQIALVRFAEAEQQRQRDCLDAPRGNKFGAKGYFGQDGKWHASRAEGKRWEQLKLMQRSGLITNLIHQPSFELRVNGVLVSSYRADAEYYTADGERVVEDTKGARTAVYRLKRLLMQAIHGITIREWQP